MPLASFQDLCTSLCALAGVDAPQLAPDEHGTVAFTITCEGVDIGFVEDDSSGEPAAVMVASYGPLDEANELQLLRGLLDTNFLVSGVHSPAFVRNPVTRVIATHQSFVFARTNVQDVYGLMVKAVAAVLKWKKGDFLSHGGRLAEAFKRAGPSMA